MRSLGIIARGLRSPLGTPLVGVFNGKNGGRKGTEFFVVEDGRVLTLLRLRIVRL